MRIVITVEEGPSSGRRWLLRPGDRMVFGRTERSDIVIDNDPLVSSCHFRVCVTADACTVEDLQSTNGTLLNGSRVNTSVLTDGDQITAGRSVFLVKRDTPDAFSTRVKVEETPATKQPPLSDEELKKGNRETWDQKQGDPPVDFAPPINPIRAEPPRAPARPSAPRRAKPSPPPPVAEPPAGPVEKPASRPDRAASPAPNPMPPTETPPKQSPPTKTPSQPAAIPPDFGLEIHRCDSSAWCAIQPASGRVDAAAMIGLIGGACPIRMVIDYSRAGVAVQGGVLPGVAIASLVAGASVDDSPHMVKGEDVPMIDWVLRGWGNDAMLVLFSYVEIEPILGHFHEQMLSAQPTDGEGGGILELCQPSTLEPMLRSGEPTLVSEILDPCEAILVESTRSPGGWAFYGNLRMMELFSSSGIRTSQD